MEGLTDLIQLWCAVLEVYGYPEYTLSTKLKLLKGKLQKWSKTFGELTNKKNSLLNELAELDQEQDNGDIDEDEMMIRATVLVEIEDLAKNEEASSEQKSKIV